MKPLFLALTLALTLPAAAFAPRWPAAALAYWQQASPHIAAAEEAFAAGWSAYGDADAAAVTEAAEAIEEAGAALAKLEPPPALLPLHSAATYAAGECSFALTYAAKLAATDQASSAFAMPVIIAMRNQCATALQSTRQETTRYAATVGGLPPAK